MSFIETDCCIQHQGKSYCASGSYLTDDGRLFAYMGKDGSVNDWQGNPIGRYTVHSTRRAPRHWWLTDRIYTLRIRLTGDSRLFKGQGYGEGMYLRARVSKA